MSKSIGIGRFLFIFLDFEVCMLLSVCIKLGFIGGEKIGTVNGSFDNRFIVPLKI